ncbi:MAG TPA: hypothetical protein DET40_04925 [Lentisphaeria bacterium]|nr:MAG: hypothetical protein A2X45_13500 [Lentisphaerae bacterium GWF2_50_93]HCE42869.1 hypothetical protein [Lentisphaeria bacterium]
MFKEWLVRKISLEEAEKAHMVLDKRLGPDPLPFGFQYQKWLEFKNQLEEGDELWKFHSPTESWQNLCGRAGICILRKGDIVDCMVTTMN